MYIKYKWFKMLIFIVRIFNEVEGSKETRFINLPFVVMGIKPRTSYLLGGASGTELNLILLPRFKIIPYVI